MKPDDIRKLFKHELHVLEHPDEYHDLDVQGASHKIDAMNRIIDHINIHREMVEHYNKNVLSYGG